MLAEVGGCWGRKMEELNQAVDLHRYDVVALVPKDKNQSNQVREVVVAHWTDIRWDYWNLKWNKCKKNVLKHWVVNEFLFLYGFLVNSQFDLCLDDT